MMSFNDFVEKHSLKNKATSKTKTYRVSSSFGLGNVGIYPRSGLFSIDVGIVNLHPSKGTHWVAYMNENFFESNDCAPPQEQPKFIIKRSGLCLFPEYKIQGLIGKRTSNCASYCFYWIT